MYYYSVVKEEACSADIGRYTTYGLLVEQQLCGCRTQAARVADVSVCRREVEALAQLYQQLQVEPCHLADVLHEFYER